MGLKLFIITLMLGFPVSLFGHSGTDVQHTKEQILEKAKYAKNSYVQQERIDYSWGAVEQEQNMEETIIEDFLVWRVSFSNDKVADPTKRRLYLFFKQTGQFIGVSYKEVPGGK